MAKRHMEPPTRMAQPQTEHPALHQHPLDPGHELPEIALRLLARTVRLRDRHREQRVVQLEVHLGHISPHRRLRHLGAVLGHQTLMNPPGRVPLLARHLPVRHQPRPDDHHPRPQRRRHPLGRLTLRRDRRRQRLAHRAPMHTMLLGQSPDAQTLITTVLADTFIKLHPRHLLLPRSMVVSNHGT